MLVGCVNDAKQSCMLECLAAVLVWHAGQEPACMTASHCAVQLVCNVPFNHATKLFQRRTSERVIVCDCI